MEQVEAGLAEGDPVIEGLALTKGMLLRGFKSPMYGSQIRG